MSAKFQRRRLLVDPAFQLRLVARMVVYLFLYTVVVVHLGFFFERLASVAAGSDRPVPEHYLQFLGGQRCFLLALILVVPVLFYDLLKFSHRIAGPLFRCRHVMKNMASGTSVSEFQPRKHDLMKDLFEAFNTLINEWNMRTASGTNGRMHDAEGSGHINDKVVAASVNRLLSR